MASPTSKPPSKPVQAPVSVRRHTLLPALRCLDNFIQQKREGKDPVYRAADVGLKEKTDFWQ